MAIIAVSCTNKPINSGTSGTAKSIDTLPKDDLRTEKTEEEFDSIHKIVIGYFDTYEKLSKLVFETTTEKEFLSIEPKRIYSDIQA